MTEATFDNAIVELLERLDPVLAAIRHGGEQADLLRLQKPLLDLIALIERDPGIEAATGDLYAAAEALVADSAAGSQPMIRKQRLLIDAQQRFRNRLGAARPLKPGSRKAWLHGSLRFSA